MIFSPRLLMLGAALLACLAIVGGIYAKGRHDAAEKAKAAVATSQQAQRQAEVTTQALDTHTQQTIVIKEREARGVQIVQQAAGSDTPLPPAVRDAWARSLQHDQPSQPADSPSGSTGTLPPT